jgi:hypothetical protein
MTLKFLCCSEFLLRVSSLTAFRDDKCNTNRIIFVHTTCNKTLQNYDVIKRFYQTKSSSVYAVP